MPKLPSSLALSLILLIAGAVGYGVWRVEQRDAQNQPFISLETHRPAPRTLPPPEAFIPEIPEKLLDTSDWKTYTSEAYGFSIKYPKDWRADEDEKNDEQVGGSITFAPEFVHQDFFVGVVAVRENFVKSVTRERKGHNFVREEYVTVNGIPMVKEIFHNPSLDYEDYSYLWSKNGWTYIYRGVDERKDRVEKTMLFSMKFIP